MPTIVAEYIWIGSGDDCAIHSKTRVIHQPLLNRDMTYADFPNWDFDGSSTGHSISTTNSEIILKPCFVCKHPLLLNYDVEKMYELNYFIVLCSTYLPDGITPTQSNNRHAAHLIMEETKECIPWFGLEQEYFLCDDAENKRPVGFVGNLSTPTVKHYCGNGIEKGFRLTRPVADEHLKACVIAGIKISGMNAEVAPGQWEFQIGPCEGISQGDHMWVARFLLIRVAEKHGLTVNFLPKLLPDPFNGSGCHANYSTELMRQQKPGDNGLTGLDHINNAINKLSKNHDKHMKSYGSENDKRMTGKNETASFDKFTSGVAARHASVRIGTATYTNSFGYFEDRRPSSNCDPYLVTSLIQETCVS
jgi:glutamine synthetase